MNLTLRRHIAFSLVELLSKQMGYSFGPDRISRIADESIRMAHGGASLLSIAVAFELDLLLYGDPEFEGKELIGLHEL